MAQFNIGDNVIRIDDNAHGVVIKVTPGRGRVVYTVNFDFGSTNVLEADLRANFDVSDPFERCKSGIFGSYSDYSMINTTFKIKSSNKSTISSLKASKTLFRPYQFKPLLKFLNSPNRRLLVADEVGLGKTIEAGHIMLELKARKELKNVLIVCPKSLQEKWKSELYEKFGLAFKIYEDTKDLIDDLSTRGRLVRGIINYERIRTRREKDKEVVKGIKKTPNLAEYLSNNSQQISLVLCDEAHKMRNRETLTYKGAEILMGHADTALFLTATPVMIDDENLYNLLHLLDNANYDNLQIFRNRMNENRPFVKAISSLNHNISFSVIYDELMDSEIQISYSDADENVIYSDVRPIGEVYKEDPVFEEITELLKGEDTLKARARLQYLLSTMSIMNTVFSRTRKREVTTDMSQAERKPHLCKVDLHEDEQIDFNKVIKEYKDDNSYTDDWGDERMTTGGALGLVQKKRQVASSVWAYLNKEEDLDKSHDAFSCYEDAKVDMLLKIIEKVFAHGNKKIIVFALFKKTIKYLNIRLKKFGYNSVVIHGDIENRADVLYQFKTDENIHILLSSEVGSEGLDMQFCDSMVNYDLPWNPMVVEQRIGRIDRFGQKSPVVNIYNMVVADSIQEEIYERLLERIGIFQSTIGDMEAILDAVVNIDGKRMTIKEAYDKMEKEFYTKELTPQERERKMAEVERAIENEKEHLRRLQEGLTNTLTNDAYFQEEINRILNRKSYVTKEALHNYLESIIRMHLTTCDLTEIKKDIWEFKMPMGQTNILRKFLTQYCDNTDEAGINAEQFKRKIEDKQTFHLTFSQEIAYGNPTINYLNIYHPMIQACLNYFTYNRDDSNSSFSYALTEDDILQKGDKFYMGLYQLTSCRNVQGVKKESSELLPVLFNLKTGTFETDQNFVDHVYRRSHTEGREYNATNEDTVFSLIDDMNYDFTEFVSKEKKKRLEEEKRQVESARLRYGQQTIEYYKSRINNLRKDIENWEWQLMYTNDEKERRNRNNAIRLRKGLIARLEKERDEKLAFINEDKNLGIEDKLLSLNLINII